MQTVDSEGRIERADGRKFGAIMVRNLTEDERKYLTPVCVCVWWWGGTDAFVTAVVRNNGKYLIFSSKRTQLASVVIPHEKLHHWHDRAEVMPSSDSISASSNLPAPASSMFANHQTLISVK